MQEQQQASPTAGDLHRPRIGLDLHVVDGIYQGSRTHCLELFSRVIQLTPQCDFVVFLDQPSALRQFSDGFSLPNVCAVRMAHASPLERLLLQLPKLVRRERIDLLHTQYIIPAFLRCRTAVTIHDILFESHPQFFDRFFVARSRALVRRSARKSSEIFTVSEFSKAQIATRYRINPDRIHTIYNGVDDKRFCPGVAGEEAVRAARLVPGGYFLTVGRLEPRKNHANLLRAWSMLPSPRPRLAIIGQAHFRYQEILRLRDSLGLMTDVLFLGNIPDDQIPHYFRHAKGLVYCSAAEGFGMPVLEAMASGIPVISSSTTALLEICADAALLVSPDDIGAIRNAVIALNTRFTLREDLVQRGFARIANYNWNEAARIVSEVYVKTLSAQR